MRTSILGCVGMIAVLAGAPALAQEAGKQPPAPKTEQPKTEQPKTAPPKTEPAKTDKPAETKPAEPAKEQFVYVTMKTSLGDITLELNKEKAPLSVENFLKYVDAGFYEGTIFHRVIDGFMVQGGGFTADMKQKATNAPIKNEWKNGLKNARGTVAMARTQVADSATSQFFINLVDNAFLDQPRDGAAYAVFGRVVGGMEVVDKIKAVKTTNKGMHQNVPETPVTIDKVKRLSDSEAAAFKGK